VIWCYVQFACLYRPGRCACIAPADPLWIRRLQLRRLVVERVVPGNPRDGRDGRQDQGPASSLLEPAPCGNCRPSPAAAAVQPLGGRLVDDGQFLRSSGIRARVSPGHHQSTQQEEMLALADSTHPTLGVVGNAAVTSRSVPSLLFARAGGGTCTAGLCPVRGLAGGFSCPRNPFVCRPCQRRALHSCANLPALPLFWAGARKRRDPSSQRSHSKTVDSTGYRRVTTPGPSANWMPALCSRPAL